MFGCLQKCLQHALTCLDHVSIISDVLKNNLMCPYHVGQNSGGGLNISRFAKIGVDLNVQVMNINQHVLDIL